MHVGGHCPFLRFLDTELFGPVALCSKEFNAII